MKILSQSLNSNWHYSTIVVGDLSLAVLEIENFLNERFGDNFSSTGNPDYWRRHYASLGVEEGRELSTRESRRPVKFPAKVFVLEIDSITTEAQNSLLKTLEEPSSDTYFFLVVKQAGVFLPTILSRCQIIVLTQTDFPGDLKDLAIKFLQSDMADRFNIVKDLLKTQEDKPGYVLDFLNCLQKVFWEKGANKTDNLWQKSAEAISSNIIMASARGSSPRLILEHLSAVLPII